MGLPFVILNFVPAKGKTALFVEAHGVLLRVEHSAFCALCFDDFFKLRKDNRSEVQPAVLLQYGNSAENESIVFFRGKSSARSGKLTFAIDRHIVADIINFIKFVFVALFVYENGLAHRKGIRLVVFCFNGYVHKKLLERG